MGIDVKGNIFGATSLRFDLNPIDPYEKMSNVEPLRNDIDKTLKDFILYGILGPNGKFIASGAKFNSNNANSRAISLRKKGFSCIVEDDSVVIHMCSKLWVLLKKHSFVCVENIGEYKNFFDVIQ